MSQDTTANEPLIVYVDPEVASRDGLNVERLRAYYRRRNIHITTDPADQDANVVFQASRRPWTGKEAARQLELRPCRSCGEKRLYSEYPYSAKGRKLWVCTPCREKLSGPEKTCRICRETKPQEDFTRSRNSIAGRRHECKTCRAELRNG